MIKYISSPQGSPDIKAIYHLPVIKLLFYSGIDVVLNHRLTESGFGSKKDYTVYLKDYMKKIVTYLESNGRGDEVDTFKKNINGYMKDVLGRFKDLQFFVG